MYVLDLMPYDEQLETKQRIRCKNTAGRCHPGGICVFETVKRSPREFAYRNKMEFSFGDEYKGGPLSPLGSIKRQHV